MIENLLVIGIGGTGAKCIEAFVQLCAIGLGPKNIDIFLIDIDTENGNLTRTRSTIQDYIKIKSYLAETDETNFFFSNIKLLNDLPWSPLDKKELSDKTLGGFINQYPTPKKYEILKKALFTEEELKLNLNKGCKAHPNIGSFLLATIFDDEEFNRLLIGHFQKTNPAIFLFHSIFGGTGASGGPVIINGINDFFENKTTEKKGYKRIPVGDGVLMPYFIVPDPGDSEEVLKIKSATFDLNAAAALPYYKKNVNADIVYLAGDLVKSQLKKYASGASTQINDAHMLEFISSIYALDFCRQPIDTINALETKVMLTNFGNHGDDKYDIYFEDLPNYLSFGSKKISLKRMLTNFQILNVFYTTFYSQITNSKRRPNKKDYTWLLDISNPDFQLTHSFFAALKAFMNRYHNWMIQMKNNNAPLNLFPNLDSIYNMMHIYSEEMTGDLKNIDNVNKYLNVSAVKHHNSIAAILNRFFDGINNLSAEKFEDHGGKNE